MKKRNRESFIKLLALMHRYLYLPLIFLLSLKVGDERCLLLIGIGLILYAVYSIVGYRLYWKHIFCSWQNAHRKEMTPDRIRWGAISKTDAYGAPVIFAIMGVFMILGYFVYGPS